MIKKTLTTLKENPLILLWFAIPLLFTVFITVLGSQGLIYQAGDIGGTSAEAYYSLMNRLLAFLGIVLIYFAIWGFLLYPAIMRYIYWTIAGEPRERWFARSLPRYWWRFFVIAVMYLAAAMVAAIPFIIAAIFATFASGEMTAMYVIYAVMTLIIMLFAILMYMGTAAAYAEDEFGTALSNMFKAGFKYFFRSIPIIIMIYIPTAISMISSVVYNAAMPPIWMIITSVYSSIVAAFASVFFMHCYLDYKSKLTGSIEQIADEVRETEARG